ncbi:MAG: hypothetical protein WC023_14505 [Rhodocyclaceae bacterium]
MISPGKVLYVSALIMLLAGCADAPKGDPVRGMEVHKACLDCHGTGLYTSENRKIKSVDALRKEVVRWGDYYSPGFSEKDVDDMTAYLNQDFYKF